jgi:hypothetical protein
VRLPRASTTKTTTNAAGNRRVRIVRRFDGLFSYEEEDLVPVYEDPELAERLQNYEMVWSPPVGQDLTLCESQEAAEREASGKIKWLAEDR